MRFWTHGDKSNHESHVANKRKHEHTPENSRRHRGGDDSYLVSNFLLAFRTGADQSQARLRMVHRKHGALDGKISTRQSIAQNPKSNGRIRSKTMKLFKHITRLFESNLLALL